MTLSLYSVTVPSFQQILAALRRVLDKGEKFVFVDCRNPNELLVAEITAWRVQKLLLQSPQTTSAR